MKFLGSMLLVGFFALAATGCAYTIQAKDSTEGNIWVTKGGSTPVWHCTAAGGTPNCKKVMD